MSTLFFERNFSPFDLLFKDFYKSDLNFQPANEARISHPIDIYEEPDGLHFEIACTGLTKDDVEVNIEGDILKISYTKGDESTKSYIHKGIAKRSFNLGYKISPKFNLSKAEGKMNNGLLSIVVPFAEESKPKALKIS